MLALHIVDETSPLQAVVLGRADGSGDPPDIEEAYDPKSIQHLKAGTYPREQDMVEELKEVEKVLEKYNVEIFRPEFIPNCNQVFVRDIGFVIEDKFIKANILPDREKELMAIQNGLEALPSEKVIQLPEEAHVEGGDVMPHHDYLFIGTYRGEDYADKITARTNPEAVSVLKELFPQKNIKSFNLRKSNTNPLKNALHLDCCFQPVGNNKALIHRDSFLNPQELEELIKIFGEENIFDLTEQEMYQMNSNVFSINENVIVSEKKFTRLNAWLKNNKILVEEVSFSEIAKQEGLLRCSTLPLIRV